MSIDGSQHKAPFGGEGTGPDPTDRGKSGWKWSIATNRAGIPIGWEIAGANRNDCVLLEPTLHLARGAATRARATTTSAVSGNVCAFDIGPEVLVLSVSVAPADVAADH